MGANQVKDDHELNDLKDDEEQRIRKQYLAGEGPKLFQLARQRGFRDWSLFEQIHKSGLSPDGIIELIEKFPHKILLMKYGRIHGYPSFSDATKYFVLTFGTPQFEDSNFLLGLLFPTPFPYDNDSWNEYYIRDFDQLELWRSAFHDELDRCLDVIKKRFGIFFGSAGAELMATVPHNEKKRFFSRLVRITFCIGLMGYKQLFINMKSLCIRLWNSDSDKRHLSEKNLQKSRVFQLLVLSRCPVEKKEDFDAVATNFVRIQKNLTEEEAIRQIEIMSVSQQFYKKAMIKNGQTLWEIVEPEMTQLDNVYLFDKDTKNLIPISRGEDLISQPVCWKNCIQRKNELHEWISSKIGKEESNIPQNFIVILSSSEPTPESIMETKLLQ
jgi:hypothetical protein